MMKQAIRVGLMALALLATPAVAQFSDSYYFLKAVKDRDFNKANEIATKPGKGAVIIDTKDVSTGDTALHIVTRERDVPWMNYLLIHNANPNIRDKQGNTPLIIAAQIGFRAGAESLIAGRASIDAANNSGETALIKAVQVRDLGMVQFLIGNGANPNKSDTIAGMSARDYALRDTRAAAILKALEVAKIKKPVAGPK
jgi:uncharacterized protein